MKCLACGEELVMDMEIDNYQVDDILECEACGVEMKVLSTEPMILGILDKVVQCQDCGNYLKNIEVSDWELGDVIECEDCGAEHEVIGQTPFKIELIDEEK